MDFLKLKSGNSLAQFFAIFMVSEDFYKHRNLPAISEKEYFDRLYKGFISEIKKYENIIKFSKSSSDYNDNKNNEIISAFLTIEDGKIVDNDLKNLQ